jgi:hypothetical protein
MRSALPLLVLCTVACGPVGGDAADTDTGGALDTDTGGDPDDTADTDTSDTSDTSDTDTADTDTDTGDTTSPSTGLLRYVGTATALDGAYAGAETVLFADATTGTVVCEVALTLASTETRTDCGECDWAYTVAVTGAQPLQDTACAAVGWEDPASIVGSTRGYGYVALYFGHAPVLMIEADGVWNPAGYAGYDPASGAFTYDRDDGYHPY